MVHVIDLHFLGNAQAIAAFLVETAAGPVLIETGPHSTFPVLKAGIQALGYQPEQVKHVLLTHIHLDHAGAAWNFAQMGANIYLHEAGYRHMADPSKLVASAKRIYQDDMERLWSTLNPIAPERLKVMAHGETLLVGSTAFVAWHTPGHAQHHIAWQRGHQLFTGDVAGVRIGDGPVVGPCPPPDIDLEAWQASINLMRSLPVEQLYLTHFGLVTDKQAHLDQLQQGLQEMSLWMKERLDMPEDVLRREFHEWSYEQLRRNGVQQDAALSRYDAANPDWMSVAGLSRYWKKKAEGSLPNAQ